MNKPFLIRLFWTIFPFLPLSLFFSGPMDLAKNVDGPAVIIPAGHSRPLDGRELPEWWTRFDLNLRFQAFPDCQALRVGISPEHEEQPVRCDQEKASFVLRTKKGSKTGMTLINRTDQDLIISKTNLNNYSAINTGAPRVAVLLSPYAFPAWPALQTLGLLLAACAVPIPGLILLRSRVGGRRPFQQVRIHLIIPWSLLAFSFGLLVMGRHLLLSWETVVTIGLAGYLLEAVTSRLMREKLMVPLVLFLILICFAILLGTALGVGIPPERFGVELIYQTHYITTAIYAGAAYLVLVIILYRKRKEWFSPDRHLFLSSIWFVFLPLLVVYLSNGLSGYGGDTTFNSLLPWRLLQGEGLSFSKEYVAAKGSWGLLEIGEYFMPTFPLGPGFLGLPTALIQYFFSAEPVPKLIAWNQKVTAVWVAALSAAIIFQVIYLLGRRLWLSLLLTAAFALGTTQATISAVILWQHGPAVLLICLGLYFLVKGQEGSPAYYPLAALPLAFLPLMRTQAVLFFLAGLASVMLLQPRLVGRFILWSLPGIVLTLWVNLGLYHTILGGYGFQASGDHFTTPMLEGVTGSLFSPNRGLLVFSPFLVLGIVGGVIAWARRSVPAISFGSAAMIFFLIHAKYAHWHGGYCAGPRFSSELVPVLIFFSFFFFHKFKSLPAYLTGWILVLISIAITLPGFFFMRHQGQWSVFPDVDRFRQERVWDFRDWLPIHFRYYLQLKQYQETPAFPFVTKSLEPLPSRDHLYRAKAILDKEPVEVLKLTQIPLKTGRYQIRFTGEAQEAVGAKVMMVFGFTGQKTEETLLSIEPRPGLILSRRVEIEKPTALDVRLILSGQGSLILDTVQIIPLSRSK
jgi:hypothetical protein